MADYNTTHLPERQNSSGAGCSGGELSGLVTDGVEVMQKHEHWTMLKGMKKIGELDVGDLESEKYFNYAISKQTWSGTRELPYSGGTWCRDDGKAHKGTERIILDGLQKNRQLVILKRIDPTVKHQMVNVYINNRFAGVWETEGKTEPFLWHESMFIIPSEMVTKPQATIVFEFVKSDFDVNIFHYWLFQLE